MIDTPHQISDDRFLFYADYFAIAADSGISSAQSLLSAVQAVPLVDVTTWTVSHDAITARNNLITSIQTSYQQSYTSAASLVPMSFAFNELANHIMNFTGGSLDDYLTSQNIKVPNTYAKISTAMGNNISTSNIG